MIYKADFKLIDAIKHDTPFRDAVCKRNGLKEATDRDCVNTFISIINFNFVNKPRFEHILDRMNPSTYWKMQLHETTPYYTVVANVLAMEIYLAPVVNINGYKEYIESLNTESNS